MAGDHKLIPECKEIFRRLDEKMDRLLNYTDKINGRYEKHIEESTPYRIQIERQEVNLNSIMALRRWWNGAVLTIVFALLSLAMIWGSLITRVSHIEDCIKYDRSKTLACTTDCERVISDPSKTQ
jgi:hypothetical protein